MSFRWVGWPLTLNKNPIFVQIYNVFILTADRAGTWKDKDSTIVAARDDSRVTVTAGQLRNILISEDSVCFRVARHGRA
jgi:hypothetical protein